MLVDPQFKAEAEKMGLFINPRGASDVAEVVQKLYETPKDVIQAVRAVMVPGALAKGHKTAKAADGNVDRGYVVFNQYFCADCHTLKAAGPTAYGQLGVNLNKVKVPAATASA